MFLILIIRFCDNHLVNFHQSIESSEENGQGSHITGDPSPSEVTTDNENKQNSSEEAWTDVNLNEDGDTVPITNQRNGPRNVNNIVHSQSKLVVEQINELVKKCKCVKLIWLGLCFYQILTYYR